MTIKDNNPVELIEYYLHKEEQKARLISIHELATKLLSKQATATKSEGLKPGHAVYSHLRPMYRTVHRTKPREMVLRAIRWVNPERMFPIMSWSKEKLADLSREEFEDAFQELAKIRREAHVISNRYDQMMNAIDAGQAPYHIPYAGINYMSLEEHRERATRLGAGAESWGWEIDQKAEQFKQIFEGKDWREKKQKDRDTKRDPKTGKVTSTGADLLLTIDNIDGLWEDGAPPFMRTREGKKGDRLMRARRQSVSKFDLKVTITAPDGTTQDLDFNVHAENENQAKRMVEASAREAGSSNVKSVDVKEITKGDQVRMPTKAKVWQQEFVAVPELERRPGEEVRIPGGNLKGQIRIPATQPAWMNDKAWKNLQDKKKAMFGPKGKKIEITHRPLDFYDTNVEIALRREERWTQRGLAPHRGAASPATGGHGEEEGGVPTGTPTRRRPQETSEEREAREEARRQRIEAAKQEAEGPEAGWVKGSALLKNQRVEQRIADIVPQVNDFILIDVPDDFDITTHFSDDNIEKVTLAEGGVLNSGSTFIATDNDGQRWLVKVNDGIRNKDENIKELAVSALDRALGLNLCPRIMLANNVQAKIWANAVADNGGNPDRQRRHFEQGNGHLGEWINDDAKMVDKLTFDELQGTIQTPEQRARWFGVALLDAISGNWDSWGNNLMFKPGVGVFSIDNGLSFGNSSIENTAVFKGGSGFGTSFAPGQGHGMGNTSGILRSAFREEGFDRDEITQELNDWFDETWEPDAIQAVTESFGIKPPDGGWDTLQNSEKLRKEFTDNMIDWMFGEGGSWSTWKSSGIPTHLGRG